MSTKTTRSGGKYGGNHTTVVPAAAEVCDFTHKLPEVSKLVVGFIKAGLRPVNGKRRVKIGGDEKGAIFLYVRDNNSQQEIVVYTSNVQGTKLAIARGVRELGFHLSFGG